jgi:hypothetical protein
MKCCRIIFSLKNIHYTSWLPPHNHMPPPNFPTLSIKIKRVIAWWIALQIMEDGGCSLTFAKVANHHVWLTHWIEANVPPIRSQNRCPSKETNRISLIYLNLLDGRLLVSSIQWLTSCGGWLDLPLLSNKPLHCRGGHYGSIMPLLCLVTLTKRTSLNVSTIHFAIVNL